MKATQQERVLSVLQSLQRDDHKIPEEYIRRHSTGAGLSARYFKQIMLISEVNGRISELRGRGHKIETSVERDRYGFAYHRLKPEGMTRADHLKIARDAVAMFEHYKSQPTSV
jgi:hypothetical protein